MTVPISLGFLRGQAGFLKERGFEISVATSPGPQLEAFCAEEGVTGYGVEMPRQISPLRDLVAVLRLTKVIRARHPDIVHAHTPKGGLLGMIAASLAGVPVRVYHLRGLIFETASGPTRVLLKTTERLSCLLANRVICVSPSVREETIRHGLCNPGKLIVANKGSGNGVDAVHRFSPLLTERVPRILHDEPALSDTPLIVGFVGRLVRDKGIVDLVQAWQIVREAIPNAHLILIGETELRDPVPPDILGQMNSKQHIHFIGPVEIHSEMATYYHSMDLLVLPTYREGFPNVILEASAMALPVVATNATGCVDAVVDGVTGTLVPVGDPENLAKAILAYLRDPALRKNHGEAGRERVLRDFRPEDIWQAIYETYMELLHEKELQ